MEDLELFLENNGTFPAEDQLDGEGKDKVPKRDGGETTGRKKAVSVLWNTNASATESEYGAVDLHERALGENMAAFRM